MRRAGCNWVIWVFAALYMLALALFLIGTFGLFAQAQDPLSGVFLLPLGLPWVKFVDLAPEPAWPWLIALAPALNFAIIFALCKALRIWRGTD
jgi:hypothetical protein